MLLLPIVLLFMIWLWPVIWFRLIREKLQVEVAITRNVVAINEAIPVKIQIHNASWLPCPKVSLFLSLPEGLSVEKEDDDARFEYQTFLLGKQSLTLETVIYGKKRGLQNFSNGSVSIGLNEGFGLRNLFIGGKIHQELVVLPDLIDINTYLFESKDWLGKMEQRRWILPDETMFSGIREYAAGDEFRHVAWKASARTGVWKTKTFFGSTDWDVVMLLNAQFFDQYWSGTLTDEFDYLSSVVCSWAYELQKRGAKIHLATNAMLSNHPQTIWHGELLAHQLRHLFGRVYPYANQSIEKLTEVAASHLKNREMVMVFSAYASTEVLQHLSTLARSGHALYWINGKKQRVNLDGYPEFQRII